MVPVNLKSLVGKMNETARRSLEAAAGLCLSRTNYNVEIEHWLVKLLETPNTDLAAILRHYGIDGGRWTRSLTAYIDRFKTGNARPPGLSPQVVELMRQAWMVASVEYGAPRIRSGHLLLALLGDEALARAARDPAPELEKIPAEALRKELLSVTANTAEAEGELAEPVAADRGPAVAAGRALASTPSLDQFTVDLTARARRGQIDPVLGRDAEIRQVIDILMRRRQNNPILTGEAGVGKTAVVEGFARRIAAGDVPPPLANVAVRTLDLGLLQAGAGIKGEFENRLKSVIDEVKASPHADHRLHRRGAHDDRRRRAGGTERRGQSAQAGLGPRRAADDRRHDVGRIQEVLREGRGPGAPLPGRQGRRADRGRRRRDDPRPGGDAWKSTTRCGFSTRRSSTPCVSRTVTFPAVNCPTRL